MAIKKRSEKVPKGMKEKYDAIVAITDAFAAEHLNEEYAQLIRELVAGLARKRPSPIAKGHAKSWACGATHAIGLINFLYDSSQEPHIKPSDLYKAFGVAESTGQGKSKHIRDLFKMSQMDPDWTLPSRIAKNPMVWYIRVNGVIMDARHAPREIQEIAYENGVIPYIPANA